ncbi:MAG: hypothetical protein C0459_06115 [Chitinophaga sp.]|jgi:uncharacterized protein YdeI (YjbR/CyaY-like superfamily)|nr:hypothetical protein [Chitinophaga sp.]
MNQTNPKVDAFLSKAKKWKPEMEALRAIVLSCGLTEELKWYQPCYTYNNTNVLIVSAFKENCVLSFFKGVLLKDTHQLLTTPGENSQSTRWIKFTDTATIKKLQPVLKAYIKEAITIEKAGIKVPLKKITERTIPAELEEKFNQDAALKKAFTALTPGRQRAYLLHFSQAKQAATRIARIEKYVPKILVGKGIND